MNYKLLSTLLVASLALTGCDDSDSDATMSNTFQLFLESIEYNDANLQQCVETVIDAEGYQNSAQLQTLSCDQPITDVTALSAFSGLASIDLTNAGMNCADIESVNQQLIAQAKSAGKQQTVSVVNPQECFYNDFEFADQDFRACVLADFNENSWGSAAELTALACDELNIKSLQGLEIFTSLSSLDITNTTVNCAEIIDIKDTMSNLEIASPLSCSIENIVFSADLSQCIADNMPASGFTIDLTELTCANTEEVEIIDISGLESLTSLTSLDLSATSADCLTLSLLVEKLPDTIMAMPASCSITPETLIADLPKTYLHEAGELAGTYQLFADAKLVSCFDRIVEETQAITLADFTALSCGFKNLAGEVMSNERAIASIAGVENLVTLQEFVLNKSVVVDYTPILELTEVFHVNYSANETMSQAQFVLVGEHLGDTITKLGLSGMPQISLDDINLYPNVDDLNLALMKLKFDAVEPDWGTLEQLQNLSVLKLKSDPIISLEPLICRGAEQCDGEAKTFPMLSDLNIEKAKQGDSYTLPCEEISAFITAYGIDPVRDGGHCPGS